MQQSRRAFLILLIIPLLWGVTFPLIRVIVSTYSPVLFVFWRFILAAMLLLPFFIQLLLRRKLSWVDFRYGLLIGVVNSGAFVLQGMALQSIDSSRTAFLSGMNVIMVPLLLPCFAMGKPKSLELLAALVCLVGIYLMSDANLNNFGRGDVLVVASAFCIALGIIVSEKSSLVSQNLILLTFYQILFTCLMPFLGLGKHVLQIPESQIFWWGAVYCAILATVIPLFLQLKYQRYVGSSKAAIIFSLESVTATFCAWLVGERVTLNILIGGGLILLSAVLSDIWKLSFTTPRRQ